MCNEKLQYTSLRYPLEFTCICGCFCERETTRDRRAWKKDQENSNDPIFVRCSKKPCVCYHWLANLLQSLLLPLRFQYIQVPLHIWGAIYRFCLARCQQSNDGRYETLRRKFELCFAENSQKDTILDEVERNPNQEKLFKVCRKVYSSPVLAAHSSNGRSFNGITILYLTLN